MQGLAKYNDSPSPEQRRSHPPLPPPASLQPVLSRTGPSRRVDRSDVRDMLPPSKRPRRSPPSIPPPSTLTSRGESSGSKNGDQGKSRQDPIDFTQDGIHDNDENTPPVVDPMQGLSEEEIFARVSRPEDIPGIDNWGIPPAVDPDLCSPQLKAKISQFLNIKKTQNQHINTSLLQSTSFHNPHIYSKLVEFVDLSERKSHFTHGGWLTRVGLEDTLGEYGPKKMGEEQRRREEEGKKFKEVGAGRSKIDFQGARRREGEDARDSRDGGKGKGKGEESRDGGGKAKRRDAERDRGEGGGYEERDRGVDYRDRERDRDRDRERERQRGGSRLEGKYRDTLGLSTRSREGGWDERDMTKRKPKYRYY